MDQNMIIFISCLLTYLWFISNEARLIKIGGLIRTLIAGFNFGVALNLYMAITFLVFVGTGGELNPRRVIITLSLLGFLRNISASFLIRCVFLLFEAKVGFTRIQVSIFT